MNPARNISGNEEGYVLVVALMIMAILSLIGVVGINTSIMEQQIAGNIWNRNRTFYRADGGISRSLALIRLLPGNVHGPDDDGTVFNEVFNENFSEEVKAQLFSLNAAITDSEIRSMVNQCREESIKALQNSAHTIDCDFDEAYPWGPDNKLPAVDVGFLYIGSEKQDLPGEDLSKKQTLFDIYSQFIGPKRSEAIILQKWKEIDD